MNKKNTFICGASFIILLALTGCTQVSDQAQTIKDQAEQKINGIQSQYETTKNQVLDTKAQIDQKVEQAKTAADAVGKLVQ
jgi:outer membrane murein-binding lipoprotein Lpp